MQYVSAEWVDDGLGGRIIKATGDDGVTYWVSDPDSDVPPWPQYLAGGGQITGEPPPQTKPVE
jgi:hypothetical protein